MQHDQRGVEAGPVGLGNFQEGRQDNRHMAKNHGEDEPDEQAVQNGVVERPPLRQPIGENEGTGQNEPDIAARQADGHVTGQSCLPDGVADHVKAEQPDRFGDQRPAEERGSGVMTGAEQSGTGQQHGKNQQGGWSFPAVRRQEA